MKNIDYMAEMFHELAIMKEYLNETEESRSLSYLLSGNNISYQTGYFFLPAFLDRVEPERRIKEIEVKIENAIINYKSEADNELKKT